MLNITAHGCGEVPQRVHMTFGLCKTNRHTFFLRLHSCMQSHIQYLTVRQLIKLASCSRICLLSSVWREWVCLCDWHAACCHPPIHQAPLKTMGCLVPAMPSLPVQRDMGAKDRCRLISANLISGVCLSQLHGLHINWDHANTTRLNLLNYRLSPPSSFFLPLCLHSPPLLGQMDVSSLFSVPQQAFWGWFW